MSSDREDVRSIVEEYVPRTQAFGYGTAPPARGGTLPSGGVTAGLFVNPNAVVTGTIAQVLNTLVAQPFDLHDTLRIDQMLLEVTTAGTTANVMRAGIYNDNGSGNAPGALLIDAGTQDATTLGVKTFSAVATLQRGRIWVVTVSQVGVAGSNRSVADPAVVVPQPSVATTGGGFLAATGVTGALPATAPALSGTPVAAATRVYFRTV